MATVGSVGDVQVAEDMAEERAEWRVQQISWIVWVLILAGALLGLMGPGPLSRATAVDSSGSLRVDYYRLEHYQAPAEVKFSFPSPVPGNTLELWLNSEFMESVEMESISPAPVAVMAAADRSIYSFALAAPGTAPGPVILRFKPNAFGRTRLRTGIVGRPELSLRQFVFP